MTTVGHAWGQFNFRYYSIAQAGYFMIGLAAISAVGDSTLGASGVVFFLATYAFTNLGAFLTVLAISEHLGSDGIADYAGMGRRAPLLAAALGFCLVSLIGIPPTAGFVAKVYIFNAAVQSDLVWLVIVAVLNTVVSAYCSSARGTRDISGARAQRKARDRCAVSALRAGDLCAWCAGTGAVAHAPHHRRRACGERLRLERASHASLDRSPLP